MGCGHEIKRDPLNETFKRLIGKKIEMIQDLGWSSSHMAHENSWIEIGYKHPLRKNAEWIPKGAQLTIIGVNQITDKYKLNHKEPISLSIMAITDKVSGPFRFKSKFVDIAALFEPECNFTDFCTPLDFDMKKQRKKCRYYLDDSNAKFIFENPKKSFFGLW